jgi:predicted ester cyclase
VSGACITALQQRGPGRIRENLARVAETVGVIRDVQAGQRGQRVRHQQHQEDSHRSRIGCDRGHRLRDAALAFAIPFAIPFAIAATSVGVSSHAADSPALADAARLEHNKALVRGYLTEVSNQGNLAAAPRYFAPDVSFNGSKDLRPFLAFRQLLRNAFPDHRLTIVDQVAEGDRVVTRVRFEATHLQPYAGIAPTGRRLSYGGVAIDRVVDGKVVEMWHMANPLGLPDQLKALLSASSVQAVDTKVPRPD